MRIALALAALLCAPAAAQDFPATVGGWEIIDRSSSDYLLMRAIPGAKRPYSRAWVRMEARIDAPVTNSEPSSVGLYEFDCVGRRMRSLQITVFKKANMVDPGSTSGITEWRYAIPGTLGEAELDWACAATDPK